MVLAASLWVHPCSCLLFTSKISSPFFSLPSCAAKPLGSMLRTIMPRLPWRLSRPPQILKPRDFPPVFMYTMVLIGGSGGCVVCTDDLLSLPHGVIVRTTWNCSWIGGEFKGDLASLTVTFVNSVSTDPTYS